MLTPDSSKTPTTWLCLNCAELNPKEHLAIYKCSKCGFEIQKHGYLKLYKYSEEAIRYGHDYRKAYEKQMANSGKIEIKFCLHDPQEWTVYLGLAALSGVIGNASFEVVKSVAQKIIQNIRKQSFNEQEFLELQNNLTDFCKGFSEVDTEVKHAIIEEMLAHQCSLKDFRKLFNATLGATKDKTMENAYIDKNNIMKKIVKKMRKKPTPTPDDFSDFWGNY